MPPVPHVARLTGWRAAVLIVAVAAVGRALASWGVDAPWIAPDEPTYALLGRSLWHNGTLSMLGQDAPFYGVVYPLLVGLPLRLFDIATGVDVLRVVQAVVMAATGLVVYAWGRRVLSDTFALVATVLSLAIPAFVYTGLIMTEAAYYPIATLALWAIALALERPTLERQALAVIAILVTSLTRIQGLAFVPALVTAVFAMAAFERSPRLLRSFGPTLFLLLISAGVILALHETGGSGDVLGAYGTTANTSYAVGPALRWVVWHAADLFLLVAGVPLLAFCVLTLDAARGRERDPAVRALIAVGASYALWSVVQVGVFASRFAGILVERNLITVAPPLFIAFALWLQRGAPRPQPSTTIACLLVAAPAFALDTATLTNEFSRQSAFTPSAFVHLLRWTSPGWVHVVWLLGVAAVVLVFLLVPARRTPLLAALTAALLIGASAVANTDVKHLAASQQRQIFGTDPPTWIDRTAAGPVTYLEGGSKYWNASWLTAFWNTRIDRVAALVAPDYGPLPPHLTVSPRFDGALFSDTGQELDDPYVVASDRFSLVGTPLRTITSTTDVGKLTLWQVEGPARLALLRTNFQPNGDIYRRAEVEVFSCGPGELQVTLLGKDNSPVLIGVEGGTSRRFTPGGEGGVAHAVVPAPENLGGATRCRFWIETPGIVGTTTVQFVHAS
jgi:Dolichyl-phosphate-mannose-protein mannosyltransferase